MFWGFQKWVYLRSWAWGNVLTTMKQWIPRGTKENCPLVIWPWKVSCQNIGNQMTNFSMESSRDKFPNTIEIDGLKNSTWWSSPKINLRRTPDLEEWIQKKQCEEDDMNKINFRITKTERRKFVTWMQEWYSWLMACVLQIQTRLLLCF